MKCEVLLRLKDGTQELVLGYWPYFRVVPKLVTQTFVRPRNELDCVCTKKLEPKTDRRVEMRICTGEFLYVETNGNGVPVYDQVP